MYFLTKFKHSNDIEVTERFVVQTRSWDIIIVGALWAMNVK